MTSVKCKETVRGFLLVILLLSFSNQTLGLCQVLGCQLALYSYQAFHKRLILFKLLILATRHGARYNKRCTGIVNQHGVHLIDNGVIVHALYQILRILRHVVTQIVKTEFVICTKGDIRQVCTTACLAVGLVLVNAIHAETMEHVNGSHPFRVTLGQIVIDRYHMNTIASQRVKENGKCSGKGLTLSGKHLGDFSLMQHCTSEQLHIKVNHSPLHVVSACYPMV